MLLAYTKNIPQCLVKELATFETIPHSVTMVIVLFSLQTLVYIKYCNLIGSATIGAVTQVPYATVTRPLLKQRGGGARRVVLTMLKINTLLKVYFSYRKECHGGYGCGV